VDKITPPMKKNERLEPFFIKKIDSRRVYAAVRRWWPEKSFSSLAYPRKISTKLHRGCKLVTTKKIRTSVFCERVVRND